MKKLFENWRRHIEENESLEEDLEDFDKETLEASTAYGATTFQKLKTVFQFLYLMNLKFMIIMMKDLTK